MNNIQEYVDQCVAELSGPNAFKAWHSLVETGPTALPLITEAFRVAEDMRVKTALVRLVSEYRTADAIPFLQSLLTDKNEAIWKVALDGLVILGSQAALHALQTAKSQSGVTQTQRWAIDEAILQIGEGWG